MRQNIDSEELMLSYLFGELPEVEQSRLEERFFTDDEYYEQLLALEDELRYDYAAGGLTPDQRTKFERRFLDSPYAHRRTELATAVLGKVHEAHVRATPAPVDEAKSSLWQSLLAFFSLQPSALQFSLAAASVVLLVGATWLFYQTVKLRSQVTQLETARAGQTQQENELRARQQQLNGELERERGQRAQLEQQLAQQTETARERERQVSSPASFFSFLLTPGLVRGADSMKRLSLPLTASQVRLQLKSQRPASYQSYRAVLQTLDGRELWSRNLARSGLIAPGQTIMVSLPAKRLPAGDYILALRGQTPDGKVEEIDEYYFSVVRQ
jgi:hypothetical protein